MTPPMPWVAIHGSKVPMHHLDIVKEHQRKGPNVQNHEIQQESKPGKGFCPHEGSRVDHPAIDGIHRLNDLVHGGRMVGRAQAKRRTNRSHTNTARSSTALDASSRRVGGHGWTTAAVPTTLHVTSHNVTTSPLKRTSFRVVGTRHCRLQASLQGRYFFRHLT